MVILFLYIYIILNINKRELNIISIITLITELFEFQLNLINEL